MTDHIATVETEVEAPASRVWVRAHRPSDVIQRYMFRARVVTDWKPGSSIVW